MNSNTIFSHYKVNMILLVLFMYISGCKNAGVGIQSRAIGAPGEVLLVMDSKLQQSQAKKIIRDFANEEFPSIPQPEPMFKLTTITPNDFEGHFKAYRNIIIVQQKSIAKANVKFASNTWASHQQVVEIEVPNSDSFSDLFNSKRQQIFEYLYYGDLKTMQSANLKGSDAGTKRFIEQKYGLNMILPRGYRLVKDTANFCWFRFDRLETTLNIVIKSFDIDSLSSINNHTMIDLLDEVGKKHIPGPSDLTFMQTQKKLPVIFNTRMINQMQVTEVRGLWMVEGYFMGGPFVNYFIKDEMNNRLLMIDGFVYAPQKQNKAYYVRQIESILHSVKIL